MTKNLEGSIGTLGLERTSRSGRNLKSASFRSEEDLTQAFIKILRRSTPGGWALLREIDAGVGVADLVLVESQREMQSELRLLRQVPLRLAPLLNPDVANRLTSLSEFMQATGMSRTSALRSVNAMAALRMANRDGERLNIRAIHSQPYPQIITIEAKLRDWKRALTQAYRNRQFCTQSWVIMDGHYAVTDLAIASFSRAQVGLATCSPDGQLYIHVHAETLPPRNTQRNWTARAVIARSPRQFLRPLK